MKVKLCTTTDEFDALHRALEGRGKRPVKVPRDTLSKLLIDHTRLLALHQGQTSEDTTP